MFRLLPLIIVGAACAAERVVINEIHFQPADKKPLEFVELHNAGDTKANLSGWMLDKFAFPAGTEIAPGGFLVVAQNPVALEREFGVKALGPLPGKLSNEGEKLTLRNGAGKTLEELKYGVGFPWPSASAGLGSSMEKLNPTAEGSYAWHWRASGFPAAERGKVPALIPPGSQQWRWRKGTGEASQPAGAWRAREFPEGPDWQAGRTGIGYGDNDDATVMDDMAGRYSTLFLRHRVNVAKVPASLAVRVRVDDGCILWINGREAARLHVPAGEPKFDGVAEEHEAGDWEQVMIEKAGDFLTAGDNVVAVQVFNSAKESSDLSFDLVLEDGANPAAPGTSGKRPTPGVQNSVFTPTPPATVALVKHEPQQPKPGEPVKVTAFTARGAAKVTLQLQVVEPGAYIRKTDPDYEARWQELPMRAEGQGWVALVPADVQKNRRLVRYRVVAEGADGSDGAQGTRVRAPFPDDPSPNFAYFTWAGPGDWAGASEPGKDSVIRFSAEMQRSLQTFVLVANEQDVSSSQWNGGMNHRRFTGTFVYEGRVLDHIEFNNRGSASTYVTGKNKWGFHFLPTHELPMRDQWGRPYKSTWNSFAMNACASPWVQINRGMAGLDEAISFRAYQLAGVPASDCLPVHFRVVTTPEENGKTQYEGDLWGLYQAVEDMDGAWLENKGFPDGIVFKPEDGVKHRPSAAAIDPGAVWGEFQGGPRGDAVQWWRSHMDMQAYYSFHAIGRLVSNVDIRPGANHGFYQHPQRGWQPVPWDLDMQFIPRTHQPGYIDQIRCLEQPALKIEYQNRAREILDLLGGDPSPTGGQIGQLVAEYARLIEPPARRGAPEWSWAQLDRCRWNFAPQTSDKGAFYRNPASQDMMGGQFSRTLAKPDFAGFCKYIVDFCTDSRATKDYQPNDGNHMGYGFGHLLSECRDKDAPARPTIQRTAGMTFASAPFSDAQGPETFAGIQWRIAEIGTPAGGPWLYEIQPKWTSEVLPATGLTHTLPAAAIQPGRIYRVRARHLDKTGRWGHWSAPVQMGP